MRTYPNIKKFNVKSFILVGFGLTLFFLLNFSGVTQQSVHAQNEQTDLNSSVIKNPDKKILFYWGNGCSHCAKVKNYFNEIDAYNKYPIESKEIYFNADNRAEFNSVLNSFGVPIQERGVPTIIIGNEILFGDTPIINQFEGLAEEYLLQSNNANSSTDEALNNTSQETVGLWLIISAALVDAVNPCAFAVLLILLTTVLSQKSSRKKVLASGFAFSLAIFGSYFLMGLGVYSALASAQTTSLFTTIVGVLAILLGLFNLKDFLWYGKTAPMEVPMSWRPKMASVIEKVTNPIGALIAGVVVSLFLLPCTSGPYLVVLGLLAETPGDLSLYWYLLIYNLVFVLPMILITLGVAYGLKVDTIDRLRNQHIDKLHLIAGLILIGLGVYVIATL